MRKRLNWALAVMVAAGSCSFVARAEKAVPDETDELSEKPERPAKKKKKKKGAKAGEEGGAPKTEDEPKAEATASPAGSAVTSMAQSMKLGFEYHAALVRSDRGLVNAGDDDPKPQMGSRLVAAKLKIDAEVRPGAELSAAFDMASPADPVEYAKGTYWITKKVGLAAGKDYVGIGGFEAKNDGYASVLLSSYNAALLPLASADAMLEAHVKVLGTITVQLTQDRIVSMTDPATEVPAQPAMLVEWLGDFKGVKPLVQVGSYDAGRSIYFGAGMGLELSRMELYLDFINDLRSGKFGDKRLDTTYRLIALEGKLHVGKWSEAFFKLSSLDVAQPEDDELGIEDSANNSEVTGTEQMDDDELAISGGFRFGLAEKFFRPYAALTRVSGRFVDPDDPEDTVSRADMSLFLGVVGEI